MLSSIKGPKRGGGAKQMEKQLEAYVHAFVPHAVSGPFNKYLFHLNK